MHDFDMPSGVVSDRRKRKGEAKKARERISQSNLMAELAVMLMHRLRFDLRWSAPP